MLPYIDLNRLATAGPASFNPDQGIQPFNGPMLFGSGRNNGIYDTFTPFQPDPPSVIDQRWPAPHEQFQQPPTFNQRWPGLHEQFQNMDHPLFEGPGETDEDFFRTRVASLSPYLEPGGMRDLGIEQFTSPFAPSPFQDLNQYNRLGGMTGPYGGTDPRFFGGGVNMSGWNTPDLGLTPQQHIDHRFPTPWEQQTFMSGNDPGRFNHAFNQFPSAGGPSFSDWTRMAGGDFADSAPTAMGSVGGGAPVDDPRGDFIGPVGGRNTIPTPPGGYGYPTPLPVNNPPPFFGGGMGPGGIPFAPGLTPQGFTPSLPNLGVPLGGGFAINNWV